MIAFTYPAKEENRQGRPRPWRLMAVARSAAGFDVALPIFIAKGVASRARRSIGQKRFKSKFLSGEIRHQSQTGISTVGKTG